MADYISSITYARFNSNNALLASSNDGAGDGSGATITEVIQAPTNTGKFVTGAAPTGNQVVCTTDVSTTFESGQFLFYFDASGNAVLIGQILSISTTTITLTANIIGSGAAMANKELGASYTIISSNETFYIRVGTASVSGSGGSVKYLPNLGYWRVNPAQGNGSIVNATVSSVVQYSNIGNPLSISGAGQFISFRINSDNNFIESSPGFYWSVSSQLPQYIWLRCLPAANTSSVTGFSPSTMYKFTTDELMKNAIEVTTDTDAQTLLDAGYDL